MNSLAGHPEAHDRRRAMLRTAMGADIAAALADPAVIEVMVNPDGSLRLDRLGEGRIDTGTRLGAAEVERIIRLVASHVRVEVHAGNPVVSAELPETGERFEGLIPPVSTNPCFAIRKPAVKVYTLDNYVADRILSPPQADTLRRAITERKNLVIAGSCPARRARHPHRGYKRIAMHGAGLRGPSYQGWRRQPVRSCPIDPPA